MMGFVLGVCIKTEKLEKGRVQIRSKRDSAGGDCGSLDSSIPPA